MDIPYLLFMFFNNLALGTNQTEKTVEIFSKLESDQSVFSSPEHVYNTCGLNDMTTCNGQVCKLL